MTLRHYQIFIKVCERLNMTAAAEDMYLSQPAISQAIKDMETHYGVKLFERTSGRLRQTPDCLMLREYVDSLLACHDNIEKRLWIRNSEPEIRLGLDTPSWDLFMPWLLERYMAEVGDCAPVLFTNPTGAMMHSIAAHELDLALVNGSVLPSAALAVHKLADDELVFVCKKHSRHISVTEGETISADPDTIAAWPMLLPYKNSASRSAFNSTMSVHGIEFYAAGNFNNDDLLLRAVEADLGIGVISCHETPDEDKFSTFKIDGLALRSDINLVYQKHAALTPEAKRLRDFILENCTV